MLNLERLRVLHALYAAGSVVGAARALHVTTSAISQQMARLERETDQRLTEREGRGIRLTRAGQLLAEHAGELLAHVERVEADLAARRGAVAGPLAVAAFATAARGLLPLVLRDLRSRYPQLTVSLAEREPHESLPALCRGHLDVAIVQDWATDRLAVPPDVSRGDLLEDRYDLALPVDHPLAGRREIALKECAGDDWITWSTGQICHDWLVCELRADGLQPRVNHTVSEHSTQLALVAAGLGVALIPRLGREPAPQTIRFVPVTPPLTRRVYALWRTSTDARPAIRAIVEALSTSVDRTAASSWPARSSEVGTSSK